MPPLLFLRRENREGGGETRENNTFTSLPDWQSECGLRRLWLVAELRGAFNCHRNYDVLSMWTAKIKRINTLFLYDCCHCVFFYLGYNGLKNVNDHYLFRLLLAQLNNCFFFRSKSFLCLWIVPYIFVNTIRKIYLHKPFVCPTFANVRRTFP